MCEGGRNIWRVASFNVMLILPDIDGVIDIALHVSMIPSHYSIKSVFNNMRFVLRVSLITSALLSKTSTTLYNNFHSASRQWCHDIIQRFYVWWFSIWSYFDAWKIIFLSITSQLNFNHIIAYRKHRLTCISEQCRNVE